MSRWRRAAVFLGENGGATRTGAVRVAAAVNRQAAYSMPKITL